MDCVGIRNVSPSQLALVGAGALVAVLTYTCSAPALTLKVIALASTFFLAVCCWAKMQKKDTNTSALGQRPPAVVPAQNVVDTIHLSITYNLMGERNEVEVSPTATVLELKAAIVNARLDVCLPACISLFIDGDEEELDNRCRFDELGIDASSQLRALCIAPKTQDEVLEIIRGRLSNGALSREVFMRGVTTNTDGNVVHIYLRENDLQGTIPPEIALLTSLRMLNLSGNQLAGPIPAALGQLAELIELNLANNQLTGPIPGALGQLAELIELNLANNQLTGPVPAALGQLAALETLHLDHNQLTGPIPGALGQLAALQRLFLYNNQLAGPIPAALGQLAALQDLNLRANQLTGPIPAALGQLAALETLQLDHNQLTGPIPGALGQLAAMKWVYLHTNQLTGPIPAALGQLAALKELSLEDNRLTGLIPAALGQLAALRYLALGRNQLIGSLPEGLRQVMSRPQQYYWGDTEFTQQNGHVVG